MAIDGIQLKGEVFRNFPFYNTGGTYRSISFVRYLDIRALLFQESFANRTCFIVFSRPGPCLGVLSRLGFTADSCMLGPIQKRGGMRQREMQPE